MIALNNLKIKSRDTKVIPAKKYISQFENAVKNYEQIIEEEKALKNKVVHMRLASYFQ